MPNKIEKAYEISDAKIRFVSLVDKAANNKRFLIAKADGGNATFTTYGRILKADAGTHYVTGVVYEPLVEDTDGNFMTEDEIRKAAHWFAKNGDQVDIQHSFEATDGATVVETYIAPCDMTVGDEPVVKGTWLMTVEITDTSLWEAIEKGQITGFSMGGIGKFSKEDTDLENLTKAAPETQAQPTPAAPAAPAEADIKKDKGFVKNMLSALGFDFDVVDKGAVKDLYDSRVKSNNFWEAFYALQDTLAGYDWYTDTRRYVDDEDTVRAALEEFNAIVIELLTQKSVTKALSDDAAAVEKAGKKISAANKKKLDEAYDLLTELREAFADAAEEEIEKEDSNMTQEEIRKMVSEAVAVEVQKSAPQATLETAEPLDVTPESIQKMIDESIAKAIDATKGEGAEDAPEINAESVQKMIDESVQKAIEPVLKARGIPSNLNDEQQPVEKNEADVFSGFFI